MTPLIVTYVIGALVVGGICAGVSIADDDLWEEYENREKLCMSIAAGVLWLPVAMLLGLKGVFLLVKDVLTT